DARGTVDSLDRMASQDREIIVQTRAAKHTADSLSRTLETKQRDLQTLADPASQSVVSLQQAHTERTSYLASLASQQRLNAASISSYQQQALAVEAKARELAIVSTSPVSDTTGIAPGAHTLTVTATGYSINGPTTTGAPAERLLDHRPPPDRRADGLGRRCRRSERDPAGDTPLDSRLRLRRRGRYGRGDPGRDHRSLVPHGRAGEW